MRETQLEHVDFIGIPGLLEVLNKTNKVASREFLYRAIKRRAIPSYRVGRRIFVRLPEVLEALRVTDGQP